MPWILNSADMQNLVLIVKNHTSFGNVRDRSGSRQRRHFTQGKGYS